MSKGMEMMLGSMLGITPEQMEQAKQQIETLRVEFPKMIEKTDARIVEIENMLRAIILNQQSLYRSLVAANVIIPVQEVQLAQLTKGSSDAKPN